MLFHPTTTVNILRGVTEDTYGDEDQGGAVVASNVPAHITEVRRQATTPATDAPRVVRYYTGRIPGIYDLQPGDRIEDAGSGLIYTLDSHTRGAPFAGAGDIRMDLRRVT